VNEARAAHERAEASRARPVPVVSVSAVQAECSGLVAQYLKAARAAGFAGAATPPFRRLVDRMTGRDRSWTATHSNTFRPSNAGSPTGRSHLSIRYALTVDVRGNWKLTANYSQPPSSEVSSHLVISGERGNYSGELRGASWEGRRSECVTIVREILTDIADENRVTFP
jgi:hypothetical protein